MDRRLFLLKDLATSFNFIGVILKDVADDLEQLIDELVETNENTKPLEQYPIGEE